MIRAVVFDLDGTLVSFAFDVVGTRRVLIDELARRGYDTSTLTTTTVTQSILDTAKDQIDSGLLKDNYEKLRSRVFSMLDKFEMKSARDAKPLEDTAKTLETLRLSSIRLAVLTNNGRAGTRTMLKKCGIADLFEFVLTREEVAAMKPKPDGIQKAVSLLKLPKDEVLYVGDSVYDIRAAVAAGVRIASVATGSYSPEKLLAESPSLVLRSLSDLPRLLQTLR